MSRYGQLMTCSVMSWWFLPLFWGGEGSAEDSTDHSVTLHYIKYADNGKFGNVFHDCVVKSPVCCVLGIVSEDSNVRRMLVKQSYALKTAGEQSCESARKNAMEESSRIITSDGTVIRTLLDGGTEVIVLLLHYQLGISGVVSGSWVWVCVVSHSSPV